MNSSLLPAHKSSLHLDDGDLGCALPSHIQQKKKSRDGYGKSGADGTPFSLTDYVRDLRTKSVRQEEGGQQQRTVFSPTRQSLVHKFNGHADFSGPLENHTSKTANAERQARVQEIHRERLSQLRSSSQGHDSDGDAGGGRGGYSGYYSANSGQGTSHMPGRAANPSSAATSLRSPMGSSAKNVDIDFNTLLGD